MQKERKEGRKEKKGRGGGEWQREKKRQQRVKMREPLDRDVCHQIFADDTDDIDGERKKTSPSALLFFATFVRFRRTCAITIRDFVRFAKKLRKAQNPHLTS